MAADEEIKKLLTEVLAELKKINDKNKENDEKEFRKQVKLQISTNELAWLFAGVLFGFMAQVFYDFYASFFHDPYWKLVGGSIIIAVIASLAYIWAALHERKYRTLIKTQNKAYVR